MNLKPTNKILPEFNMSSMTDIVFLLLIFFLLTSSTTKAIDLSLPKAEGKATQVENVTVSIDKSANYYIGNNQVKFENLETELKRLMNDGQKEKPTIILKSEKTIAIEKAIAVVDIANKNGFKIVLAVTSN